MVDICPIGMASRLGELHSGPVRKLQDQSVAVREQLAHPQHAEPLSPVGDFFFCLGKVTVRADSCFLFLDDNF